MISLFNNNWYFCEYPLDSQNNYICQKKNILSPISFFDKAESLKYKRIDVPHDYQIFHTKELYKDSLGFYKKEFTIKKEDLIDRHLALRFEAVYMNCAIWINGNLAGQNKYGYSTFEIDITPFVKEGKNSLLLILVYQNCNTRWYSGAGIIRDVYFINKPKTYLTTDGVYLNITPLNFKKQKWQIKIQTEIAGEVQGHKIQTEIYDKNENIIAQITNENPIEFSKDETEFLHYAIPSLSNEKIYKTNDTLIIENPELWDIENPYIYTATTKLLDKNNQIIDSYSQNCGFKYVRFDKNKGLFLNDRHIKIFGACHHHDQGILGSAFNINALKRQFLKLKEMGINSVRCSHNPPPKAWMDLADELGLLIDDECFDMWQKNKTPFDYANFFNEWYIKDTASWIRKDRNHPCLLMWSIGNEINDTHDGNGLEITKKLYEQVIKNDPEKNAIITMASNYMWSENAQECAKHIDLVGYNYLENLYPEHHKKYRSWKIYGSETGSTVQSRGVYHFPEEFSQITFSDGQCSSLGNCTVPWGAKNTQTVITIDRDIPFSMGQYIWTGWDYIGEPTPYHTKSSYFGQIDTAGFEKDTFYLYKSEWLGKKAVPFVHLLPYWDWNEGQIIDVKAYTNCDYIELFFNNKSLGKQKIDHEKSKEPFGKWKIEYHNGTIKAVGYDKKGNILAQEEKKSFGDSKKLVIQKENYDTGNLFFYDIFTVDENGIAVENAKNYVTINVSGDAVLLGLDNGDSTDYDEYTSADGKTHTRRLFNNKLVAIVRAKSKEADFKIEGQLDVNKIIPTRKIELSTNGSSTLSKTNSEIQVTATVFPKNSTNKNINWNAVLKECIPSDCIQICDIQNIGSGTETATIKAQSDGNCILRVTCKNNSELDEVISDLPFFVKGLGKLNLNPFNLIEACRFANWDHTKTKPKLCLESGVSVKQGESIWISFKNIDFGNDGADTIHIPIFTWFSQVPLEIWDGEPKEGTTENGAIASKDSILLGKYVYSHESIYNVYSENIFTLNKRLFGVHTISIALLKDVYFKGFYFDKSIKAFSKLRALDATTITGDSFTKTDDAVTNIGNNVSLDFDNMNFDSKDSAQKNLKITICGKSNSQNNVINIKFFDKNGTCTTQTVDFLQGNDYEEKVFELQMVKNVSKISFVFLPGCNFDFEWFKFE